jgi:hypothetical protein
LLGKYVSQSVFEISEVGAFSHVLFVHPLLEALTVHFGKNDVHNVCELFLVGALAHVFSLQ